MGVGYLMEALLSPPLAYHYQLFSVHDSRCLQYRSLHPGKIPSPPEASEVMICLLREALCLANDTGFPLAILGAPAERVSKMMASKSCDPYLHNTVRTSMVMYRAFLPWRPD